MTHNQISALSEYLSILRRNFKDRIVDVFLFGSVARGEHDEESDMDILVIVKNGDTRFREEVSMVSYDAMLNNDVVMSALVMDRGVFEWHKKYKDPLYNAIERDGIGLWKKPPGFLSMSE